MDARGVARGPKGSKALKVVRPKLTCRKSLYPTAPAIRTE